MPIELAVFIHKCSGCGQSGPWNIDLCDDCLADLADAIEAEGPDDLAAYGYTG